NSLSNPSIIESASIDSMSIGDTPIPIAIILYGILSAARRARRSFGLASASALLCRSMLPPISTPTEAEVRTLARPTEAHKPPIVAPAVTPGLCWSARRALRQVARCQNAQAQDSHI